MMDMIWMIYPVYLITTISLCNHHHLYPCRLFEFIAFLIGSAYFVAGSYPDVALAVEDEFLNSTHDDDYDMESTNTNPTHNSFKNPLVKTNWK